MKTVGHRKPIPIVPEASGELLVEGARFNEEVHRLPTGNLGFIPKGVYRFMTHAEANRHQSDCLANRMARLAVEREHAGLIRTKQTMRAKDIADRHILERALEIFREQKHGD